MSALTAVKRYIELGEVNKAIGLLDEYLAGDEPAHSDTAYYLRGNAYRKMGNWQQALNNYKYAAEVNPDSPAVEAGKALLDILNFYHKDMYNQ